MDKQSFESLVEKYSNNMMDMYRKNQSQSQTNQFPEAEPRDDDFDFSAEKTYAQFIDENTKTGTLKVQVTTADQTIPIIGAGVSITKKLRDGVKVFFRTSTDRNGIADGITLRAPDRDLSLSPDNGILPYASYEIKATHPDFVQQLDADCQIFEGIKSVQLMNMTPIGVTNEKEV